MANTKVQSEQIEDGSITADKIADGAIVATELADNAVTTAKINADAVTGAKIADDAINSEHYTDGSIDTAHIADDQITQAKMANDSVGADELASNAVVTASIVDANVTTAKIADGNISTAKIADNAVTSAKIDTNIAIAGDLTVQGGQINTGNTSGDHSEFGTDGSGHTFIDASTSGGDIFLQAGGSTKVTMKSTGFLGLGDTSPSAQLHINTGTATAAGGSNDYSSGTNMSLYIENSGSNGYPRIFHKSASSSVASVTNAETGKSMYWGETTDTGNYYFRGRDLIVSEGNVGIGTSTVRATTHIKNADNNWESGLLLESNSGNKGWNFHTETTGELLIGYNSATNAALTDQAATTALTIDTSGKAGIGTTSPDALLEIVSTDPRIRIRDETAGGGADNGGQIEFVGYHASASDGKREFARIKGLKENSTGGDTDGYLSFLVNQGGTLTENMRLESNGLVGIGTSTPGTILDVKSPGSTYWAIRANSVDSDYGFQARGQGSYAYACLDTASNSYRGRWQYNGTLYTQDGSVHDIDSDERLKEDITDCPSQWSLIKDLPLQRFKWKDRRNGDIFSYGWIAQPTKAKYPEFVEPIPQPKEDIDEGKEDPEYLTVRSGDIQRRSIAALQEAMARIEALEARIEALES